MTVSEFDMAAQRRLEEARTNVATRKAAVTAAAGRRGAVVAVLVIGIGLLAAPFIFQMLAFDNRAPKGGEMIDEFRPYMTDARITKFDEFMALINRAEQSFKADLRPVVAAAAKNPAQQAALSSVDDWAAKWEKPGGIHTDMTGILRDVRRNLDNYKAVDNLPPFKLFPFFFIMPGLIIAGLARAALRRMRRGAPPGAVRQAPPARASRGGGGKGGKPRAVVVTEEGGKPRTVPLGADPVTLGRADECTVPLADTYVSQMHTKIYPKDGLWFVMDLGSTNGTYLNRVKVGDPLPLNPGDEVRLGRTVVEVRAK